MRKFLIPLAAIAATVAVAAPASASPRWAPQGYGYGAPVQPMYGSAYGFDRRMQRMQHRMERRAMRASRYGWNGYNGYGYNGYGYNNGYGYDGYGYRDHDRDGRDDRYENGRGWDHDD